MIKDARISAIPVTPLRKVAGKSCLRPFTLRNKEVFSMKTIFAIFGVVLSLMLLAGCGEPSKKTCKQAIKPVVEERIPTAWLTSPLHQLGGAANIRVKNIKIIKIGKFQTSGTKTVIPVEARLEGYYDAKPAGWSGMSQQWWFGKVGKFFVYRDSSGDWKAQYQELDRDSRIIELKDSHVVATYEGGKLIKERTAAWSSFNNLIASLVDLVNKTFYQKQFREKKEFESPEEYQQATKLFWEENRTLYRDELQRFKLPILQPDKTITTSDYKIFRLITKFKMSEYNFQNKSFVINVDFKEMIDFGTVEISGVTMRDVPPIPIIGYFNSVYLHEEDIERAKQIKSDYQAGNFEMLLDFALYVIDLKIMGIHHEKLDVYPLVLQVLSGKIYNTKTDPKYEKPILTWEGNKSIYATEKTTSFDIFGFLVKRSVAFYKNFRDLELPYDKAERKFKFPVLQNDSWDYQMIDIYYHTE